MKQQKKIAVVNAVCQIGAGRSATGSGWTARLPTIMDYLRSCDLAIAETQTIAAGEVAEAGDVNCRYLHPMVDILGKLYEQTEAFFQRSFFPIMLGGDHSLAVGSASAAADYLRGRNLPPLGLLWVDAHLDMNTPESTPSGNIHGMALAALLGVGQKNLSSIGKVTPAVLARHSAVLAYRFADRAELPNLLPDGPTIYSMRDIDRGSPNGVITDVLKHIAVGTGGIHLSIDLDSLDPSVAPAVNTPFPGGLTFRELRAICESVASTGRLMSLDIVEHNPDKGHDEIMLPIISELIAVCCGASSMPDIPHPAPTRLPADGNSYGQMV